MTAVSRSGPDREESAPIPRGKGGDALNVAAREIFAERGYHGASIRDIAKRAGLSLSALYYWHSSKQELFAALLEDSIADYFRTCDATLRSAGRTPDQRLAAVVRATVDYRVRHRVESAIAAREFRNLEPAAAERIDRLRESASQLFQDIVDDGVRTGAFTCEHPTDARRAVQAACNAIAQWYEPDGDVSADELAERYVAIALRIVGFTGALS